MYNAWIFVIQNQKYVMKNNDLIFNFSYEENCKYILK